MENMKVWNALKQPPASALREIKGGRLKGMTDVNPQWRYQAMTEQFGQCGVGWKYEVEKVWSEPLEDNQILAFAKVNVYVSNGEGIWSEPIPGIGGSMLVSKESAGLHASDEGYKMAVTDALSVAMKMLGVAADVYAGLWDGKEYKEPVGKKTTEKKIEKMPDDLDVVRQRVRDCAKRLGWSAKEANAHLEKHYGGLKVNELSKEALDTLYTELNVLVATKG